MRNPAIELYRIALMLGIVALHTLQCAELGFSPLARWVEFCVDGFVFISGWYGIKFGWTKLLRLYGLALWCSAVYAIARRICLEPGPLAFGGLISEIVHRAGGYWFVNAYAVLMCFAPIVNAAFEARQTRRIFVPILFVAFGWSFACMVPGVKGWLPAAAGFGSHTVGTLLGVYVVARMARLDRWDEKLSGWQLVLMLALLSALAVCNLNKYNSPVAVLLGGVLFILFGRLRMDKTSRLSALILKVSPSMLAVYLLHGCGADFVFVRSLLSRFESPWLSVLIGISAIFATCVLIDLLRRLTLAMTEVLWRKR